MSGGIYLVRDGQSLVRMKAEGYDSEALLQGLLASYPDLLAGDQIDGDVPRRWILVSREASVPDTFDGTGRWAVDHLFLDQDSIPTLVEVKRSSDTRIRREVVGQMLDYAANAILFWPIERLRAQFEARCAGQNQDPNEVLRDCLGGALDPERFWEQAKTNLQAGRLRLVFVADEIPIELRRIVEYLNQQMDPTQVLAIEIKQYVGEGLRALVPRLVAQTAGAQQKKSVSAGPGRQWDEPSFLQALEARQGAADATAARKLLEWSRLRSLRATWGKGSQDGSFFPMLDHEGQPYWLFSVWSYGRVEIQFQQMKLKPPFDTESARMELLRRLNQIPGIEIPQERMDKRPTIALAVLADNEHLEKFLTTFDWVIEQVQAPRP